MEQSAKIYVAGHRGLVGSAISRQLRAEGYRNVVERTHAELDLTSQQATAEFFQRERPNYVFLAAAKVAPALLAVPLAESSGWQVSLGVWTLPAVAAGLVWLGVLWR